MDSKVMSGWNCATSPDPYHISTTGYRCPGFFSWYASCRICAPSWGSARRSTDRHAVRPPLSPHAPPNASSSKSLANSSTISGLDEDAARIDSKCLNSLIFTTLCPPRYRSREVAPSTGVVVNIVAIASMSTRPIAPVHTETAEIAVILPQRKNNQFSKTLSLFFPQHAENKQDEIRKG